MNEAIQKNYQKMYWIWVVVLMLVTALGGILYAGLIKKPVWLVQELHNGYFFLIIIVTLLFARTTHESLKAVGNNNGWLVGSLVFIPFGFWITFFIVRNELSKAGFWGKNVSTKLDKPHTSIGKLFLYATLVFVAMMVVLSALVFFLRKTI